MHKREWVRERERKKEIVCSHGIISAWVKDKPGVFFKIANQLPKPLQDLIGPLTCLYGQASMVKHLPHTQQSGTGEGKEAWESPWWSNVVIPWGVKLWLSGEANSLMIPSLLSSMSNSLCSPFY